jgi:hypothetical protein
MGNKPYIMPTKYMNMLLVKVSGQERVRILEGSQKKLEISTSLYMVICKIIKFCSRESKKLQK